MKKPIIVELNFTEDLMDFISEYYEEFEWRKEIQDVAQMKFLDILINALEFRKRDNEELEKTKKLQRKKSNGRENKIVLTP